MQYLSSAFNSEKKSQTKSINVYAPNTCQQRTDKY